ncbi:MAG: pyruvate kinase [Candidatus Njordarchaeales archaeon]
MRKTKIIATIGPASLHPVKIKNMIKEGVDIIRLNFSHGDHEEKEIMYNYVRTVEKELHRFIPIIADLTGPTIRLGSVDNFILNRGEEAFIINNQKGEASKKEIPLPNSLVYESLDAGDLILIDDGEVQVKVQEVLEDKIKVKALNEGEIRSKVSVVIPGKDLKTPAITEKDIRDLEFIAKREFNYIALSFVRSKKDIQELRKILKEMNADYMKIIAKIETQAAVKNIKEIIKESDAIMIARGDLGMEFPLEEVPAIQKKIAELCLRYGKPSILATQILDSMVHNPVPTRAEAADVFVAIGEGIGALMLSNETTIGKYPIEAVSWLRRIIEASEREVPPPRADGYDETIYEKFAKGIVLLAESVNAKILAYTKAGMTALRLSRYRPNTDVYVVTGDPNVARQINLLWGIRPLYCALEDINKALDDQLKHLKECGEFRKGDIVLLTVGMREEATDLARIEIIE